MKSIEIRKISKALSSECKSFEGSKNKGRSFGEAVAEEDIDR